jgi:phosphatidylserine decarboxylase
MKSKITKSAPIIYIDRETGERQQETVYGETELNFLYHTFWGEWLRKLFVSRPWFSTLNAIKKRSRFSKSHITNFANKYGIQVNEASKPIDQYQSLDDFFCRKLKSGVRPINVDKNKLVSPADGRVLAYTISENMKFAIKNQDVCISELIDSTAIATDLIGGCAVVVRLAPKDYHRFHFPTNGSISNSRLVAGKLESVHPIALNSGAKSFANKRTLSQLESKELGIIHMVEVGALTVGSIVQTYQQGDIVKGQEKGYFRFGGSTVVLLWGADGPKIDDDILANSESGFETLVKYGTQIASIKT